jgi:hypothetical protein
MVNNDKRNFFILLLINQLQPQVVVAEPAVVPAPVKEQQQTPAVVPAPVDEPEPEPEQQSQPTE